MSILLIISDILLRVYENSFLTFIFKIFYQSIIGLQCCISFCYTTKLISCMYTYVPSFLNLPPISPAPPPQKKTSFYCFPGGSDGKESVCNAGDLGSIPGLGRSPGEGNSSILPHSRILACRIPLIEGEFYG